MDTKEFHAERKALADARSPGGTPFIGIWTRPGKTLDYVVHNMLEEYIHRLYMALGVMFVLAVRLPGWLTEQPHPIGVMIQVLFVGPVGGIIMGYIFAAVLRNVARLFRIEVDSRITKACIAWSHVPIILSYLTFWLSYVLLNQMQPEILRYSVWLFEGTIGWMPIILAGIPFVWGLWVRAQSVSDSLRIPLPKGTFIWIITLLITYLPTVGISYTYFIIFSTTMGNTAS